MHPDHSLPQPPLLFVLPNLPPQSIFSVSSSESHRPPRNDSQIEQNEYNKTRQKSTYMRLTRQPNRKKRIPKADKRVTPLLTVRSPPHTHKIKRKQKTIKNKNNKK